MRPPFGRAPIGAALLALAACQPAPQASAVTVEEAWVQLPPVPGRPGSAYFTLRSSGSGARVTAVTSPRIERIELHETRTENGIARMTPLKSAEFDPQGTLAFGPGGKHAMLFGIDPALKAGDKVSLTITVEPIGPVTAEAEVRAFGGGHAGH